MFFYKSKYILCQLSNLKVWDEDFSDIVVREGEMECLLFEVVLFLKVAFNFCYISHMKNRLIFKIVHNSSIMKIGQPLCILLCFVDLW